MNTDKRLVDVKVLFSQVRDPSMWAWQTGTSLLPGRTKFSKLLDLFLATTFSSSVKKVCTRAYPYY